MVGNTDLIFSSHISHRLAKRHLELALIMAVRVAPPVSRFRAREVGDTTEFYIVTSVSAPLPRTE